MLAMCAAVYYTLFVLCLFYPEHLAPTSVWYINGRRLIGRIIYNDYNKINANGSIILFVRSEMGKGNEVGDPSWRSKDCQS